MDAASQENIRPEFGDWEDLQVEFVDESPPRHWWVQVAVGLLRDHGVLDSLPIAIVIVFGVGLVFQEVGWTLFATYCLIAVFGLATKLILVGREDAERQEEKRSLPDEPRNEPEGSRQAGATK